MRLERLIAIALAFISATSAYAWEEDGLKRTITVICAKSENQSIEVDLETPYSRPGLASSKWTAGWGNRSQFTVTLRDNVTREGTDVIQYLSSDFVPLGDSIPDNTTIPIQVKSFGENLVNLTINLSEKNCAVVATCSGQVAIGNESITIPEKPADAAVGWQYITTTIQAGGGTFSSPIVSETQVNSFTAVTLAEMLSDTSDLSDFDGANTTGGCQRTSGPKP